MATKKIKRFESGGVSDKDRGLEASKDDKVGFFERLRMGNIDEEGSEAYNRFGAGRGRASSIPVEDKKPTPVVQESAAPVAQSSNQDNASENILAAGRKEGERKGTGNASVAEMYQGPRTNQIVADVPKPVNKPRVNVQATKPSASASGNPRDLEAKNSRGMKGEGPPRTTVGRTAATPGNIPGGRGDYAPVTGEKVEPMSNAERNLQNILMGTGAGAGVVGALYKGKKLLNARKAAQAGAKKRANLKRDVEEGIERNLGDELASYSASAAEKAITAKQRADKTLNPNSWLSGPKGMADDFKRGGKVKPAVKKMASGGMVSNASKRADGIATKGKTRCKMR